MRFQISDFRFQIWAFALALAIAGCQPAATSRVARGHIIDVQARDIRQAESVQFRTEGGDVLRLKVAESVKVTPGHLREHMLQGEPVTVTYEMRSDGPLATAIDD